MAAQSAYFEHGNQAHNNPKWAGVIGEFQQEFGSSNPSKLLVVEILVNTIKYTLYVY